MSELFDAADAHWLLPPPCCSAPLSVDGPVLAADPSQLMAFRNG